MKKIIMVLLMLVLSLLIISVGYSILNDGNHDINATLKDNASSNLSNVSSNEELSKNLTETNVIDANDDIFKTSNQKALTKTNSAFVFKSLDLKNLTKTKVSISNDTSEGYVMIPGVAYPVKSSDIGDDGRIIVRMPDSGQNNINIGSSQNVFSEDNSLNASI
ncbi:MAG: hypothetical protein E7Z74_00860 [Methanobrevibacter millerae]|uniref:Uncharacterized protein n=1 Tax=Methanobrevibacter millerae TaxID=230361 RepID=A0A8T3VK70_9EURY|nr:hypothetical protein [Methanobrevibacter millerae]